MLSFYNGSFCDMFRSEGLPCLRCIITKKFTFIFLFHKRAKDDCQNNWRGILNSESQRHREERERLASYIPTTLVAAFSLVVNSVKHIVLTF